MKYFEKFNQKKKFCISCISKEMAEELKEHIYSKGGSYRGEWLGTLRHGKGKTTWADGTYYEGDW